MPLTQLLDTSSVDDARAQVASSYCPHDLRPVGSGTGFRARHAESGTGQLRVFALSYGEPAVEVEPVPFLDFILVSRVVAGHLSVHTGSRVHSVASGRTIALDPLSTHRLQFGPGCRLVTLKLDRPLLDRVAAGLGVGRASRAATTISTGVPDDPGRWQLVSDFVLTQALPQGLLAENALTRRHIEELTAAAVLMSFGTQSDGTGPQANGTALRRAVDYIQGRAGHDLGLLDIAAAAGVGPRSLQRCFHRELGSSPMSYVREVRLQRVRAELRADEAVSVSEVAHRWGFGNLGRFAGEYRARFGATPRDDRRLR